MCRAGGEETLDRYGVGHMVIESKSFLAPYLDLHPNWEAVYQDDLAVIYVRR